MRAESHNRDREQHRVGYLTWSVSSLVQSPLSGRISCSYSSFVYRNTWA